MSSEPPPPPPLVKEYVDHHVDNIRREIEPRLDSIDQKLAGDLVRFEALGKRVDDQGNAINLRIDDVRGDVKSLGEKMDTNHQERMTFLRSQSPEEKPQTGWWGSIPLIIRYLIVSAIAVGTVIGSAALAFVQVVN